MGRPLLVEFPDTAQAGKWMVQRARGMNGWAPGWFAFDPDGDTAAWFPTQKAAFRFASREASKTIRKTRVTDALVTSINARPTPNHIAKPVRPAKKTSGGRRAALPLDEIVGYRDGGMSVKEIAGIYGVSGQTIRNYLKKVTS